MGRWIALALLVLLPLQLAPMQQAMPQQAHAASPLLGWIAFCGHRDPGLPVPADAAHAPCGDCCCGPTMAMLPPDPPLVPRGIAAASVPAQPVSLPAAPLPFRRYASRAPPPVA